MAPWDATKAKSQIRLTAYRLAQVQDRHDQTSSITKRDIATLIGQGDIDGARNKAEKLVGDDRLSSLIERLESCCNVLLERFAELSQITDFESDPRLLEAVYSIMVTAPRTELKVADVVALRDMLVQVLGPEFTKLAMQNHGNYAPSEIIDTLNKRPPPSAQVDAYMASIAKTYQLPWTPPLLPHQKAHALSGILDQTAYPPVIDLEELRRICSRGVPQQPPWLRPRVWKLLLGTVPPQKDTWEIGAHSKRQSYYELARRLLTSIDTLSPPATPLTPLDSSLLNLAKSLSPLPHDLDEGLDASPLCPFDDTAPEGLRIETADAVDKRLHIIRRYIAGADNPIRTPEIRLEAPADASSPRTPQISVYSPPDSPLDGTAHRKPGAILHPTRSHTTSLLRLLYIHMSLHPSTPVMYFTSLLIPLYVAMVQEIEPAELAHVEADSFWLLTELWGEVGELAEGEGSQEWIVKFGQRLAWADPELWDDLNRKGLNPALPHYSYRWLTPLLTRTLSLPSVLTIWDALFTRTSRTSDHNAKLEFLLDICTSMLIHARVKLFRLGKAAPRSPGLWGDVDLTVAPPSPTPVEFEEGFIQGMALLQRYPMDELGGAERVIDIAVGLDSRRMSPAVTGLGGKLRESVWTGLMTRKPPKHPTHEPDNESDGTPSPEWPDSGAEDGDVTETPGGALLGKIGSTVWRGITNQSSMDAPSSPLLPASPAAKPDELSPPNVATSNSGRIGSRLGDSIWRGLTNQSAMEAPPSPTEPSMHSPSPSESEGLVSPNSSSSIWSYRERLKDSDTAAALSKVSTNWTAKAATFWSRNTPTSTVSSPEFPSHHSRAGSLGMTSGSWIETFPKRGSLPSRYDKEYSPPPRPNFRESRYFSPEQLSVPGSPSKSSVGLPSPPSLLIKSKSALASLTGSTPAPAPKTGPRPLLLSSSSLITPSNPHRLSRSPTPVRRSQPQRDSTSSVSSASTSLSGVRYSTHSDRDSEPCNTGRFVPLRRGARSSSSRPDVTRTARPGMTQRLHPENEFEPAQGTSSSSPPRNPERRTSSEESEKRGWPPDSPSTLPSSPPKSPITLVNGATVRVSGGNDQRQIFTVLGKSGVASRAPLVERKAGRKTSWNTSFVLPVSPLETTSDSSTSHDTSLPVRTKRHGQRPANLRLKSDPDLRRSASAAVVEQRSPGNTTTLAPEYFSEATVKTPRATDFPSPSSPGRSSRVRRDSRSPRRPLRKADVLEKGSDGEEGDDEGYDEFLSAYESEDMRDLKNI